MAQDTAPLNDDAFHEIQLSGKQLVFLFMATTVVSVFIFLCGVLVGRGVRAEQVPDAAEQAATAAAPVVDSPVPAAESGPVSAEPPAPAETPASEDLSYHDRLQREGAAKEQLKAPAEPQPTPSERAAKASSPAAVPPAAAPASQEGWVVQLIVLRNRGEASSIVQRLTAKGYPAFVVEPTAGSAVRTFKVQVGRYSDRREAEQASRRLEKEEQFKPWILR